MPKISVIGSGTWGSANAVMLSRFGHEVTLWTYSEDELTFMKENRKTHFLEDVLIPESIMLTNSMQDCADTDLFVLAVPSFAVRETTRKLSQYVKKGQIVLNIGKGLEQGTLFTLSQVIGEEIPQCEVAVMSGPSHAEEVSKGIPTTNVVASANQDVAEYIQAEYMNPTFRIYTNPDVLGVELGGSLKNVIALCAGISDGLGLGDNTKAALMTRGIVEMTRLGVAMGAKAETFSGLSGMGDLIVTCTSMHSRNRRAGILIGKGYSKDEACDEVKMVVEGIHTCHAAKNLADRVNVEMPIVNEAYSVLFEGKPAKDVPEALMGRDKRGESEKAFLKW